MSSVFDELRNLINQHFDKLKKLYNVGHAVHVGHTVHAVHAVHTGHVLHLGYRQDVEDLLNSGDNYFIQGDNPNEWLKAEPWQLRLINGENISILPFFSVRIGKYHNNIYYYDDYKRLINIDTSTVYQVHKITFPARGNIELPPAHNGPDLIDKNSDDYRTIKNNIKTAEDRPGGIPDLIN